MSFMGFYPRTTARAGDTLCWMGCNCSCPSAFLDTSIPHHWPQTPFVSPSWASLTVKELLGTGWLATSPSTAPAHITCPQATHFLFPLQITFRFQVLISPAFPLPGTCTAIFSSLKTKLTASGPAIHLGSPLSAVPMEPLGKAPASSFLDPPAMHRLGCNFKKSGKFSFFLIWSHSVEGTTSPRRRRTLLPIRHLRGSGSQALLGTAELITVLELTCDPERQREVLKASQSIKFIPTCTMWNKPQLGFLSCAWQS